MPSMSNLSDFDAPKKPWLTAFIPVIVILLAAGAYWIFSIYDSTNGSESQSGTNEKTGNRLTSGKNYYLYLSEIELFPTNEDSKSWDSGDGGPDVAYSIKWQGNEVFESTTKDDTLLANWSGLQIDLKWSDLLGKTISPNEAIQAARVRFQKNESVSAIVVDKDLAKDDKAGTIQINLSDLRIGKNEKEFKKEGKNCVRRIVTTVLPIDSTMGDLASFMKE